MGKQSRFRSIKRLNKSLRLFDFVLKAHPNYAPPDTMVIIADSVQAGLDDKKPQEMTVEDYAQCIIAPPAEAFFIEAKTKIDERDYIRGMFFKATECDIHSAHDYPENTKWVYWFQGFHLNDDYLVWFQQIAGFVYVDADGHWITDDAQITALPFGNYGERALPGQAR